MHRRRLMGLWCGMGVLVSGLGIAMQAANAETHPAARSAAGAAGKAAGSAKQKSAAAVHDSAYLVREVVYNEQHDHNSHGYWRYWIERHSNRDTLREETVETPEGPVARLNLSNGRPITAAAREEDDRRLQHLLNSPSEQAQHRKEYLDDEHRLGRILAMLPDAFVYDPAVEEEKSALMPECPCYHMRFRPDANYPARSIESRIFHAMAGDLWISVQYKRLVRLDGKLQENVDLGFGILGRLYQGGWFRLERTHVSAERDPSGNPQNGVGDWKTQRLEVHMIGRALLFKTVARETSEVRGGFTPVPSGLSFREAVALFEVPAGARPVAMATVR